MRNRIEITEIISQYQRYCTKLGMGLIFVLYAVWLIFLTSLNDCNSFHLRELIELLWQVSRPTKTPSTLKAPTMQDRKFLKYAFTLFFEVILGT